MLAANAFLKINAKKVPDPTTAYDLPDTEGLADILGDEAKSRSPSQEYPLTGKPDAGDPPVRFEEGGGGSVPAPPLLDCSIRG